jgi:hypothetical protein
MKPKPVQSKAYVNNSNELDIIDRELIDKVITFDNCHLIAEYLLSRNEKVAIGLYEELKAQRKVGA